MKLLSLEDAWELFLQRPTRASFITLREMVIQDDAYAPSALVLAELTQLLDVEAHAEVVQRVEELLPGWALCPRLHFLVGCAAEALGDTEEVEFCRFLSSTCVDGILSTGDGSRERPWLAAYPSDAQDCLARLGLKVVSQQLIDDGDALLDVIMADNGKCFCFHVTEMVAAGAETPTLASIAQD